MRISTSYGSIIEGLDKSRVLCESVSEVVKSSLKTFYVKVKAPSDVQKKINTLLNNIYITCESIGNNDFSGGKYDYERGMIGSDGDGESGMVEPDVNPSVHTLNIKVTFDSDVNVKDAYVKVKLNLKKSSSCYEKTIDDGHVIYYIVKEDGHASDFGVSLSFTHVGLIVDVYREISPLKESSLGTVIGTPLDKENCESTDVSGVSTPSGNLGNKSKKSEPEITCPKCGSYNVNIRDDDTAHCSDCNYDWSLSDGEEVKESFDPFKGLKTVKDPNPSGSLPDGYVTDGLGNVYKVPDKGYSKDYKYKGYTFRYNYKSKEVEMLNKGNVVNSLGLSSGNWFDGPDYWVEKMYSSSIHEGIDEGYYKVGKRYRTSDNMYFVVKKINKDGTIKVYDEDLGKSYDAEVSDLELLDPVMVKEGIVDKYYDFEVRDILQKLDNYIKTMKTNIKSIESKLKKGNTSCLSVKGTLDMCKNVDKISDTFGLYDYYSKDLKGVSDDDTEILMDVWYQSLDEIERKKRDIMYNKA